MKTKFLPKTWWGWIFWLMLVGIVGLLAVRSLLLWLSPDVPGYLDMCRYDNGPCEEAPPGRIHQSDSAGFLGSMSLIASLRIVSLCRAVPCSPKGHNKKLKHETCNFDSRFGNAGGIASGRDASDLMYSEVVKGFLDLTCQGHQSFFFDEVGYIRLLVEFCQLTLAQHSPIQLVF